jgi:hypothetical protein
MAYEKDENEIGALWIKDGKRGEYMTGEINGVKVVVFKNDRKPAGSKAPDWRVLKSIPKADRDESPFADDHGLPSERARANDRNRW